MDGGTGYSIRDGDDYNIYAGRGCIMGQYHLTVNLDKKEFLMPHKFGVGLKLREQYGMPSGIPDALFMLMCCSNGYGGGDFQDNQNNMIGRWAGDRIAVIGDYAEATDLQMMWDAKNIYTMCHNLSECGEYECTSDASSHYIDISDMVIPVMMLNDSNLHINTDEIGWRKRQAKMNMDNMVSMDEMLGADS